ncbi:T9SS type A sorting domain-containing protein [Cytophagaceae bacterium ABcell3]|nr:T9SS type A sorting domain-containing protein [Cytophagaceae bacterium ABcell3]
MRKTVPEFFTLKYVFLTLLIITPYEKLNAQNDEEPQFEITNIRIVGHDDRVCLDEDRKYELAFDVEGEVPEDVQFTAFHRSTWMTFVENRLDTIPYNERSFTGQFTDSGFPSSPVTNHGFVIAAINGDDTLLTSSNSFEVVQKIDVENAEIMSPEEDFAISQDTILDLFLSVDIGSGGIGHSFKIVHEESGEDLTEWQMITDPPFINKSIEVSEPGTYRLIGRSLCEDSVVTDDYFTVTQEDEPEFEITNIRISGHDELVCLGEDLSYDLAFDAEGDIPDDVEFTAEYQISYLSVAYYNLDTVSSEERSIPGEFPEEYFPSSPDGRHLFVVKAIQDGQTIAADTQSFDIVRHIDIETAALGMPSEIEITQDTTIELYMGTDPAERGIGHLFKVVHEESGEDLTHWAGIPDPPVIVQNAEISEPGTYRLVIQSLCEDSVVTDEYFTVIRTEEREGQITSINLPASENGVLCLDREEDYYLEFETEGSFPEGTVFYAMMTDADMIASTEIGSTPATDNNKILLSFPEDIPYANRDYGIFIEARDNGTIEQSDTLFTEIIEVPTNANLSGTVLGGEETRTVMDEVVYINPEEGEFVEVTPTGQQVEGIQYKLVHEETRSSITDWVTHRLGAATFSEAISEDGTYRLYGRGVSSDGEIVCFDSIRLDGFITIKHREIEEKPIEIVVRDEDGNNLQPDDDGRFVICPGARATLRVPNKENATYYWYKDGEHLESINERAFSVGVFESERLGSGDYHVRIEVEGKVYVSEPVTVIFEEPNVYVLTEDNALTASEGISYQWYRNGERLDGETNRSMTAEASGMYSVKIEVMAGCKIMSDEHEVIITSVHAEEMNSGFKVYPNPVNAEATLEVNSSYNGPVQIKVLDVTGGEHLSFEAEKTGNVFTYNVNLSGLNNGIYFVQVLENENISVLKIIKN